MPRAVLIYFVLIDKKILPGCIFTRRVNMDITKLCMLMSIVLTTLMCKADCQFFYLNPQSVTVTEGSNVRLTCGSVYLTTCIAYQFSWQRKLNQHSNIEQISVCSRLKLNFAGRSGIVVEQDGQRYHLQINNVQRDDSGTYWCNMTETSRQHSSETALLTVVPLLPKYKPSCNIYPSRPRVGETVSLECTLSERDPLSLLTWFESTSSGLIQIEDKTEINPGETYAVERELTESDNMKEFICVAGPQLNGPNCSITPLQIPTTVSISPSHLTLLEHQNATFTCDLKSTPE